MSWNPDRIVGLLEESEQIARAARRALRRDLKDDRSLVTQADREIESLLAGELERPAEGAYFIGEETLATKDEAYIRAALAGEDTYVVDPIDGTVPYALGLPLWGVSIGHMVRGVLRDGAVYLVDFGELVMNRGDEVVEGRRDEQGVWEWRELPDLTPSRERHRPLALTQAVAKRGRVDLPHPVMVLGAAVVPTVGLLQGRFAAYLGSTKLWDVAAVLPLLLRKGAAASVLLGDEPRKVTARVDDSTYHLAPSSKKRWALRDDLIICHPDDELRFRSGFTRGDRLHAAFGHESP